MYAPYSARMCSATPVNTEPMLRASSPGSTSRLPTVR